MNFDGGGGRCPLAFGRSHNRSATRSDCEPESEHQPESKHLGEHRSEHQPGSEYLGGHQPGRGHGVGKRLKVVNPQWGFPPLARPQIHSPAPVASKRVRAGQSAGKRAVGGGEHSRSNLTPHPAPGRGEWQCPSRGRVCWGMGQRRVESGWVVRRDAVSCSDAGQGVGQRLGRCAEVGVVAMEHVRAPMAQQFGDMGIRHAS